MLPLARISIDRGGYLAFARCLDSRPLDLHRRELVGKKPGSCSHSRTSGLRTAHAAPLRTSYPDLRSRPRRVTVSAHRPGPIIAHHRVTLWSATAQARDGSGRDRMLCAPDLSSEGTFYDQSPGNPEGLRAPVRGYDPYRPAQIRPAPHMYCRAGLIACGVSRAGRRNHISSHFYLLNCQSSSIRSKLPSAQDRVKLD